MDLGQARARFDRFNFPDGPPHLVQSCGHQFLRVEWCSASEQFIEQYAQAIDVAARIYVETAQLRLLRTHVSWRPQELFEGGEDGLVGQPALRGLGDAEIDD